MRLLAVFWLLLFLVRPTVASVLGCAGLLDELYRKTTPSESEILASFRPDIIYSHNIRQLSDGVYEVPLPDGYRGVLRVVPDARWAAFEGFASEVVRDSSGGISPEIRIISLEPQLQRALGLPESRSMSDRGQKIATLAVFYPATSGYRYLNETIGQEFRDDFVRAVQLHTAGLPFSTQKLETLTTSWNGLSESAKETIRKDLEQLFPGLGFRDSASIPDTLSRVVNRVSPARLDQVNTTSAWRSLPQNIRQQLADYWALYTLLGIPDFHSRNWLVHEGRAVVAIDTAYMSADFLRGTPMLRLDRQLYPLGIASTPESLRDLMLSDISPDLRSFLRALDRTQLREYARRHRFSLTEKEESGILARAQLLLRKPS